MTDLKRLQADKTNTSNAWHLRLELNNLPSNLLIKGFRLASLQLDFGWHGLWGISVHSGASYMAFRPSLDSHAFFELFKL
jgi:hypothetical protein